MSFAGQVAVVTGASSGIGRAAAFELARQGASVVCAARAPGPLDRTVAAIEAEGGSALAVPTDVSDDDAVRRLVSSAVEHYGRLDLAYNNAGIPGHGTVTGIDVAEFDRVQAVNVRGTFLCMRYEIEAMLATSGGGAIVNCASAAGHRGVPFKSAYAASKWAVVGLSKSAALDYAARGVRINVVSPGAVATALLEGVQSDHALRLIAASTPMQRIASAAEAAESVVWLLSDRAAYVTGAVLNVDGGLSAGFAADAAGKASKADA